MLNSCTKSLWERLERQVAKEARPKMRMVVLSRVKHHPTGQPNISHPGLFLIKAPKAIFCFFPSFLQQTLRRSAGAKQIELHRKRKVKIEKQRKEEERYKQKKKDRKRKERERKGKAVWH